MVWPFLGRDREVEAGLAALRTRQGLLVAGSRGAGRSRFAEELAALVTADQRLQLTATPTLRTVAFGAISPLLPPMPTTGEASNDDVLRAVQAIGRQHRDRRSVIVLDDIEHLDVWSIEVVRSIVAGGQPNLCWIATASSSSHLPDGLTALWTSGSFGYIELEAMPSVRLTEIARHAIGVHEGEAQLDIEELVRLSGGNMLALHELVETARDAAAAALHTSPRNRLRRAADRLIGERTAEQLALVDLLACVGPISGELIENAGSEHDVAALERGGVIAADPDGALGFVVPMCGDAIAASVSRRRRAALIRELIQRNTDPSSLSGTALLHLALCDVDAETGLLSTDVIVAATRAALDRDRVAEARRLLEAAHRSVPDVRADRRLELLEVEIAAAEGRGDHTIDLNEFFTDAGSDGSDTIVDALEAIVRRGHTAPDTALTFLEEARLLARGDEVLRRLDLLHAYMLWLHGRHLSAARSVGVLDDGQAQRPIAPDESMIRCAAAAQLLFGAKASEAAAQFRRTRVTDAGAMAAGIVTVSELVASLFSATYATFAEECDRRLGTGRELDERIDVVRALGDAFVGDFDAAYRRVSARLSGRDAIGLDALRGALARLTAPVGAAPVPSSQVGDDAGAWAGWTATLSWWRTARRTARPGREPAGLSAVIEGLLASGSLAAGLVAAHLAARTSLAGAVAPVVLASELDLSESPVAQALHEHVVAAAQRDPVRIAAVAATLRSLGWAASAADSYTQAAELFALDDRPHAALISAIASFGQRSMVDPRAVSAVGRHESLLTPSEFAVVQFVGRGGSSKSAASHLQLSVRTVDNHLHRIYRRFDLGGRRDLIDIWSLAS